MTTNTTGAADREPLSELGEQGVSEPQIRQVPLSASVDWLGAGWRTLRGAPGPSLLYGTLFAVVCEGALMLTMRSPGFTAAFLTGLLLIGPFLGAGLYVAARQHSAGDPVRIGASLALLWQRRTNLSLFVLFLALVMAAWVRFSALLFAFKVNAFSATSNDWEGFLAGSFDPVIVGFFVVIGALLAALIFLTSAVSVPLIVDRDAGPITAISASYRAVTSNWWPMALWAALIVVLSAVGIFTLFIGMIVLFPLLGYATWHSYRALVE